MGKRDVKGYVLVYIDEDDEGQRKISYYPVLVDEEDTIYTLDYNCLYDDGGAMFSSSYYYNKYYFGVRPVIEVPISEF